PPRAQIPQRKSRKVAWPEHGRGHAHASKIDVKSQLAPITFVLLSCRGAGALGQSVLCSGSYFHLREKTAFVFGDQKSRNERRSFGRSYPQWQPGGNGGAI